MSKQVLAGPNLSRPDTGFRLTKVCCAVRYALQMKHFSKNLKEKADAED